LLITASSLAVAFWLSTTLQRRITNPIIALAETAQKISKEHNYSLRAPKLSDDELGLLTDAFNEMLERIQAGNSALQESQLRESERAGELAVVIEAVPVPVIIVHDAEARHMTGNRAAANLVKIPVGGEISKSAPDDLKPNHFKSFKEGRELRPDELPAQRAARGEPVKDFEFDLVFDDGTVLNLLGSGTPLLDAAGQPRGAVHTLVDITERKRHEKKLAKLMQQTDAQARLFDATLSSIKDLAYTFDLDGNWIYANKALLQIWGKSLKEITGKSSLELGYPPELAARLKQQVKEVVATRQPVSGGTYFTDAAGVEDYHEYIFSPVLAADGTVTAVCGTTRLTTERKRVESMLRQNAALFSALVELAPTGMYVVDGQFRLQQINARALPAFAKVEPKIGRDFGEVMEILWGKEIGEQLSGIFRHTLLTGEAYRSPRFAEHRHDLNEDKAYEWETQRVTLPDGTHGVVCYFNDITETERNNANRAFLATINDDLLRLDTVDDILNTVCAKICGYLKLTIGCFVEINEAADISNVTHEWRLAEVPGLLGTYKLSDYLSADFQKILRAGDCFIVRDTATDSRTDAEKYAALKIRSFICVPHIADGRWKFMFDIHDSKPRDWREDEIALVRELTARIWARLERVRADSLLRQNEALFAALIEEAPVGVYVINAEFRVQQINTRALPAFEKVEPKIGRTLTEVMHIQWGKEAGDELAAIFRHTLDTGEPYISPGYSNVRADLGEEKTYEWQTRRVTLPNGSHGVVCYFDDITERIRAEQALIQAKEIAETASRSKDDFLAALSHELRTPLNPVLLIASDAANDLQLPEKTRADFGMIRRNVELEARLIDDLLDLTRITRGKLSLEKRPLDVRAVLQDAIAIVRADAETKKISLTLDLGTDQIMVLGDAVRLQQIFWNVLKNAVKFTPEGGRITVEIRTLAENGNIAIKIIDSGIGLTIREITHIFNPFAQGDHAGSSGSHQFGGLGLGLAISRMLVELHSGVIQAASAGRDQGATFTIELPCLPAGEISAPPEQPATNNPQAALKKNSVRRILLVEDHEPTRTALARLLARRDYQVMAASSVAEARALVRREKFDLVVSDIGLPDGNGYALMSELRDEFGLRGIALTGYGTEQDVSRAQNSGFVAHLTKPVRIEALEKALGDAA
jgi:PAS domain S-box-containing protein